MRYYGFKVGGMQDYGFRMGIPCTGTLHGQCYCWRCFISWVLRIRIMYPNNKGTVYTYEL